MHGAVDDLLDWVDELVLLVGPDAFDPQPLVQRLDEYVFCTADPQWRDRVAAAAQRRAGLHWRPKRVPYQMFASAVRHQSALAPGVFIAVLCELASVLLAGGRVRGLRADDAAQLVAAAYQAASAGLLGPR
jgi:hypothetical protein